MLTRDQIDRLADHLAEQLMECGGGGLEIATRIAFKSGRYPDAERNLGGMNQSALVAFFRERLTDQLVAPIDR